MVSFSFLLVLPLLLIAFRRKNFRLAGTFALVLLTAACSKNLDVNALANSSLQNNLASTKPGSRITYLRVEAHAKSGITTPSAVIKIQY